MSELITLLVFGLVFSKQTEHKHPRASSWLLAAHFFALLGISEKNSCYELYELRSQGVNADRGVTQQCTVSLTVIEAVEIEINSHNVCILELEQRGELNILPSSAKPKP